jgi:hypothetical protein
MVWKEKIGPLLAEMAEHQRDSALSKSFYQSYQLGASTLAIKSNGRRGSSPGYTVACKPRHAATVRQLRNARRIRLESFPKVTRRGG